MKALKIKEFLKSQIMSYNKEPRCMNLISEIDFANAIMHYIIGVPELRQPFIGLDEKSGLYSLRMFPIAYQGYKNLGFAYRIDHNRKIKYYRYGLQENWNQLENSFINKFITE